MQAVLAEDKDVYDPKLSPLQCLSDCLVYVYASADDMPEAGSKKTGAWRRKECEHVDVVSLLFGRVREQVYGLEGSAARVERE